ncbi:hypothetical protein RJ640_011092 [Escallonia rubra]|uniref:Uncharacterized protein n=1 Tax=Escallonia rubra TaxID=112253 RepID=A0AA88R2V8_9ASTE|nr:hypothetical protein RJ640_011092 [Escallonia rubra]
MMNASVKGRYDDDRSAAAATFALDGGDVKLRATISDATFTSGPSLNGLSLSLEKPGSFLVDLNVPKKDVRFQFMNSVRVAEKPLNLTYTHAWREKQTAVDGTLVLDSANKVSANYGFDSGKCKVKYSYVLGGLTAFEPCYDFASNSWDFAVSQRVYDDDLVRASYKTSSRVLGVDWCRNSGPSGGFKTSIVS